MKSFPNKPLTTGERYDGIFDVQTVEEASEYMEALIVWNMAISCCTREEATKTEHANVGYWSGYGPPESMEKVLSLFQIQHPVFGLNAPTPRKAFKTEKRLAK